MITKSRLYIYNNFYNYLKIFVNLFIGKNNKNFENLLKEKINKHIILTAQARVGMYYIAKYLVKKEYKKFYISPYTNIEVIEALKFAKCEINFIDLDLKMGIPNNINEIMNKKNEKKCLIITHLFNNIENLNKLNEILKDRDESLIVVEDAAINFGSKYKNKHLGTLFDFGFFSFGKLKNLSIIYGGAIYYKEKSFEKYYLSEEEKMRNFSKIYFLRELLSSIFINFFNSKIINVIISSVIYKRMYYPPYQFSKFFYNSLNPTINKTIPINYFFRFPYFLSDIAVSKYEKVLIEINERYEKASYYNLQLKNIEEIDLFEFSDLDGHTNSYMEYPIILKFENKFKLLKYLTTKNIFLRLHWYKNNDKFYEFKKLIKPNNCDIIDNNCIVLPCGLNINKSYQDHIINNIKNYFETNKNNK